MSQSIFLVTSGSYSDFTILAAFSTRQKAEELVHAFQDQTDIIEMKLDPDTADWWTTSVTMSRDGTVLTCQGPYKQQGGPFLFSPRFDFHIQDGAFLTYLSYDSPSLDPAAAVKAANETRTRLVQLDIWPAQIADNQALLQANMALARWRINTRRHPEKES